MESKHTKGEWKVNDYVYYLVMCNNTLIANVNTSHIDCGDNAKLIAAAPDLLDALNQMNDYFIHCKQLTDEELNDMLNNSINAINKAYGK